MPCACPGRALQPAAVLPTRAQEAGAKRGTAVAAYFGYMKGVKNALAMKHVPWVLPRNDTMAGPRGRRGDQVGGFTLMHVEDLRRVAPGWLKFTEDVRFDPDVSGGPLVCCWAGGGTRAWARRAWGQYAWRAEQRGARASARACRARAGLGAVGGRILHAQGRPPLDQRDVRLQLRLLRRRRVAHRAPHRHAVPRLRGGG